jgi:3-methylcrotonyl-CoA carboxylase alpha subunit
VPVVADGEAIAVEVTHKGDGAVVSVDGIAPATDAVAAMDGEVVYVLRGGRQTRVSLRDVGIDEAGEHDGGGLVRAPMHGKVLGLHVTKGMRVTRGQRLVTLEAMKMEHTLVAPVEGIVQDLFISEGAQVAEGANIMRVMAQTGPQD